MIEWIVATVLNYYYSQQIRALYCLGAKGIAQELADQVVGETYTDADLAEAVLPLAQKRWRTTKGLPIETHRRRLVSFLQSRGYDWDTINRVLEQVGKNP